jgi:hypothetical protein
MLFSFTLGSVVHFFCRHFFLLSAFFFEGGGGWHVGYLVRLCDVAYRRHTHTLVTILVTITIAFANNDCFTFLIYSICNLLKRKWCASFHFLTPYQKKLPFRRKCVCVCEPRDEIFILSLSLDHPFYHSYILFSIRLSAI